MSNFAERFTKMGWERGFEQGLKLGLEQGLEQGKLQGEVQLLLRQITRKFGPAAAEACRQRVQQADAQTLLDCADRILIADRPEAIFEDQ